MSSAVKAAISVLLLYNLTGAFFVKADKEAAKNGRWRLPERSFLLLAATGAGAGVLLSCYTFRHKIKRRLFMGQTWVLSIFSYVILIVGTHHFLR